jgi:hypothetical protein
MRLLQPGRTVWKAPRSKFRVKPAVAIECRVCFCSVPTSYLDDISTMMNKAPTAARVGPSAKARMS